MATLSDSSLKPMFACIRDNIMTFIYRYIKSISSREINSNPSQIQRSVLRGLASMYHYEIYAVAPINSPCIIA